MNAAAFAYFLFPVPCSLPEGVDMNDANRESIMKMVAEGTLRPEEAAKLLARLTDEEQAAAKTRAHDKAAEDARINAEKAKPTTEKISIPGPDGTERVVEVPSSLVPMIGKMVGEAVRQHAQKVAKETVVGARNMVLNKADEVRDTIKTAMKGGSKKPKIEAKPVEPTQEDKKIAARRQILQLVQNGRISAIEAGRLVREVDALEAYETKQAQPPAANSDASGRQKGNKKKP